MARSFAHPECLVWYHDDRMQFSTGQGLVLKMEDLDDAYRPRESHIPDGSEIHRFSAMEEGRDGKG